MNEMNQQGAPGEGAQGLSTPAGVRSSQKNSPIIDWVIRLVKGILVGVGAITPGLSGGVLMVVFGIYEPLVRFLANIRNNFLKNLLFFVPIGIGGVIGVVGFSAIVDYAFQNYAAQFTWLFIGFISGTFPSLLRTAGKQGRKSWHWVLLGAVAVGMFFLMAWIKTFHAITVPQNFFTWLLSGMLTGLGMVVPGLSPSNFLIYLGLYQPMAAGIKSVNLGVILPLIIGVLVVVFILARFVNWLFNRHYAFMYHLILGIVVGSTVAIIPAGVRGWTILVCTVLFLAGAAASYALARLDERHPHESLF